MMEKLPPLTHTEQFFVDSTPNDGYPIRILEAYLNSANSEWEVHGLPEEEKRIYDIMNEHQAERRGILKKAIAILRTEMI